MSVYVTYTAYNRAVSSEESRQSFEDRGYKVVGREGLFVIYILHQTERVIRYDSMLDFMTKFESDVFNRHPSVDPYNPISITVDKIEVKDDFVSD